MDRRALWWRNPFPSLQHLQNLAQKRIQLRKVLDSYGFDWQIWAVASSGFFTGSYNLFATNVILPALAYVYWHDAQDTHRETTINLVTLAATIIGMLLFGVLADKLGRQRLYGIELIFVSISTLGLAQSSNGFGQHFTSMSIMGWILFWRTMMGIGIGAEYPTSGVISAEWSSTKTRARMLASVFVMQPIGQLAAYVVAIIVLIGLDRHYNISSQFDHNKAAPVIDMFWRYVTGLGAIPAIIALIFRLTIPESGRWRLDVGGDPDRALTDTQAHFAARSSISLDEDLELEEEVPPSNVTIDDENAAPPQRLNKTYLREYFIDQGNWRYLAGTALSWFYLDFAYYGLQINNPRFLAKLWAVDPLPYPDMHIPAWMSDPTSWNPITSQANVTIYTVLMTNARRAMIAVSIGSVAGGLLLIVLIDFLPRRRFLVWSFVALALLTAGTGASFLNTYQTPHWAATLALFILCQVFFNLGPNSLTFIFPAEVFPTPIRCTCHGISAAIGKLSSVIVQATLPHMRLGGVEVRNPDSHGLGWVLVIYSAALFLGAIVAWAWLPDVQDPRRPRHSWVLPAKSLEELSLGREKALRDGQMIGMRLRLRALLHMKQR